MTQRYLFPCRESQEYVALPHSLTFTVTESATVDSVIVLRDGDEVVRSREPSFEDPDAVNIRDFGARGAGVTDDTAAFAKAIAAHDKTFVPNGRYVLSGWRAGLSLVRFRNSSVVCGGRR